MKRKFFSLFTVLLVGMGLIGGTEYNDIVHDTVSYFDDELFGKFIEKDANFCYSPVSIYGLLYAVQKGTQGETQNQINTVLGVQPSQYLDKRMQKTISKIPNMSNSIWYQDSLTITDEYKEFLKNIKFDENKVDFKKPEQAKENINRYIFKKTNGLLNNSIQGELPSDTKLILLNTLYFNQNWRFKFEKKKTYDEPFYKNTQDKKNVPMMHKQYIMRYYENDDVQMAELEYQNKRYSMIIILPKTIEYDLKKLTPGALIDTFNYYKKGEEVKFTLPKFEMNADYNLVPLLQSLGVKDIFDMEDSNFFKIFTSAENLYINVMNHQTYIKIDEEETKAAARTRVMSKAASETNFLNNIPKIYIFKADHPFVYVIRDNELNVNLFTGCVREM